jgi:starch phosphorylase
VVPTFNTHRMVQEYTERLYESAARAHTTLNADGGKRAIELSQWKANIRRDWSHVAVSDVSVRTGNGPSVMVGQELEVSARVALGPIAPEFVCVQAYYGENANGEIVGAKTINLKNVEKLGDGTFRFAGSIPADESGSYGLSVRVIPSHPNLIQAHELRLITWAK